MVVYLCSDANEHSHEIFTVGGGRYGRVFIGTNRGWFSGTDGVASVEDVADHIDEIRDLDDYIVPMSNNDEIMILGEMLSG
jgi:hypothetical protein